MNRKILNMKKISTLLFFLMTIGVFAQPVLTSSYFPKAGDEAKTNIDRNPNITVTAPGPNQSWNYSNLKGNTIFTSTYKTADQADAAEDYPDADIFLPVPPSFERFYSGDDKTFSELGFTSLDPIVRLLSFSVHYNTPYVLYRAPLKYEDESTQETSFFTTFPFDTLPDTIVQQVPPTFRPDTISVRVFIKRTDKVDAWGALSLPGGDYTALRQKNIEIRTTKIFAYNPVLGWNDVTGVIKGYFPQLPIVPDTSVSYSFFAEGESGPLAVVQLDSVGGVASIAYGGPPVATRNPASRPDITVTPNPTFGKVTFNLTGLTPGTYHLEILNILAKPVWDQYYRVTGANSKIKENFFFLPKGTYLYSLKDSQNNVISIKKLIVLKP